MGMETRRGEPGSGRSRRCFPRGVGEPLGLGQGRTGCAGGLGRVGAAGGALWDLQSFGARPFSAGERGNCPPASSAVGWSSGGEVAAGSLGTPRPLPAAGRWARHPRPCPLAGVLGCSGARCCSVRGSGSCPGGREGAGLVCVGAVAQLRAEVCSLRGARGSSLLWPPWGEIW